MAQGVAAETMAETETGTETERFSGESGPTGWVDWAFLVGLMGLMGLTSVAIVAFGSSNLAWRRP